MSMKKSDLDKQMGKKVGGQMRAAGAADRFGAGASDQLDRREQRRRDAEAGLVPFACKLPSDLAATLRGRAAAHAGGMNGLIEELVRKSLA
jgi:hypothetical protein